MCGLTGFLFMSGSQDEAKLTAQVTGMADAIAHRGPDSSGVYVEPQEGVALGHRRLAIIDLTATGRQPMRSHSGRYKLAYNGEIYNHQAMRAALAQSGDAPAWKGHSDTETLVAGFDAWGIEATLARAEGMFALAVWDHETHRLTLGRDRMGEKPLYYGWQGQGADAVFLFGSELKALQAHSAFDASVDRASLAQFLRHSYVGEDRAIFQDIQKLRSGEMLELAHDGTTQGTSKRWHYWSGAEVSLSEPTHFDTDTAAVDALDQLLQEVTGDQMVSDVPLGAFLSGGIDSSLIVGLMQHISAKPVHSFSIGFHEERYNEAGFAKEVAQSLGTKHTELYVGDDDLRNVIPLLPTMYDEPAADSSQIPTYLVSKLARDHVTVSLSGDGGDELFCGYDRYRQGASLMGKISKISGPLRKMAGSMVRGISSSAWDKMITPLRPVPQGKEPNGQRMHRLADYAMSDSVETLHRKLVSRWRFPEAAVIGGQEPPSILDAHLPARGDLRDAARMMQLDMLAYMPDDILAKVDRASMAVSLETRAPLLNHRVVEFAWGLPDHMKLRGDVSKWILRQVLYRYVPKELIERPKMGFEVPIGLWLRGPLRGWAETLLDRSRLQDEGYLEPNLITKTWQQHLSGSHNWGLQLWNVLMFQAWLEAQPKVAAQ